MFEKRLNHFTGDTQFDTQKILSSAVLVIAAVKGLNIFVAEKVDNTQFLLIHYDGDGNRVITILYNSEEEIGQCNMNVTGETMLLH